MYRQGITKGKARKLLADTGRYADIVYARRSAQGANSLVPSHHHHHHQQQQPPLEVVSSAQDKSTQERVEHEVVVKNKPREISPEDRMGILFGEDPIEFLSVEAESMEQVSSEDLPSQVFSRRIPGTSKKREREKAFNPSPSESHHEPETPRRRYDSGPSLGSDSGLPSSTSAPTKSQTQKDQSSSRNGQARSRRSSKGPGSLFRKLEGATGMKSKQHLTSAAKLQDDGQHRDVSNCGCHKCIHELPITKMETVTPGQGVSEKLRDLIKSRRIYKSTSLNTHPTPCLCKMLVRFFSIPAVTPLCRDPFWGGLSLVPLITFI